MVCVCMFMRDTNSLVFCWNDFRKQIKADPACTGYDHFWRFDADTNFNGFEYANGYDYKLIIEKSLKAFIFLGK